MRQNLFMAIGLGLDFFMVSRNSIMYNKTAGIYSAIQEKKITTNVYTLTPDTFFGPKLPITCSDNGIRKKSLILTLP